MYDLIARLEAATEGSRELDAAIHVAIGGRCGMGSDGLHLPPHYTASIDAALTLFDCGVPRGTMLHRTESPDMGGKDWMASMVGARRIRARSWPLALCIAALKARAA